MKKYLNLYIVLFLIILVSDRLTKGWALSLGYKEKIINNILSFSLAYNRGLSWGMLSSKSQIAFGLVTLLTIVITLALIVYLIYRYRLNYIIGEIMVVSGSVSNIIDRFFYPGVIDFISLHYKSVYWPLFNIADIAIVIGVVIMFFSTSYNYDNQKTKLKV